MAKRKVSKKSKKVKSKTNRSAPKAKKAKVRKASAKAATSRKKAAKSKKVAKTKKATKSKKIAKSKKVAKTRSAGKKSAAKSKKAASVSRKAKKTAKKAKKAKSKARTKSVGSNTAKAAKRVKKTTRKTSSVSATTKSRSTSVRPARKTATPPRKRGIGSRTVVLAPDDKPIPKTRLTDPELAEFTRLLLDKRAELVGDVEHLTFEALGSDHTSGSSTVPLHMADMGTDNWEQEFTLGLIDNERALVREIDDALDRITNKTYGVCLATHLPISKSRLRAKPWAKYCVEYATLREQGRLPS